MQHSFSNAVMPYQLPFCVHLCRASGSFSARSKPFACRSHSLATCVTVGILRERDGRHRHGTHVLPASRELHSALPRRRCKISRVWRHSRPSSERWRCTVLERITVALVESEPGALSLGVVRVLFLLFVLLFLFITSKYHCEYESSLHNCSFYLSQ